MAVCICIFTYIILLHYLAMYWTTTYLYTPGLVSLGTTDGDPESHFMGSHPVYSGRFSIFPGFYLLDASTHLPQPSITTRNVSRHCHMSPWVQKSHPVEKNCYISSLVKQTNRNLTFFVSLFCGNRTLMVSGAHSEPSPSEAFLWLFSGVSGSVS